MVRPLLYLFFRWVLEVFRSDERQAAEAELDNAVLRHQLAVLRRQVKRPPHRASDRAFHAAARRVLRREAWRSFLVQPETLLRWHRQVVARKWTRPHRVASGDRSRDQAPGASPGAGEPPVGLQADPGESSSAWASACPPRRSRRSSELRALTRRPDQGRRGDSFSAPRHPASSPARSSGAAPLIPVVSATANRGGGSGPDSSRTCAAVRADYPACGRNACHL